MKNILILLSFAMLGGCVHNARIQYDYIDVRDECRSFSEDNFSPYISQYHSGAQLDGREKNAILAKLFADCMYQRGWTVAKPGGNKKPQAARPPQQFQPQMQQRSQPAQQPQKLFLPAETLRPATGMPIPSNKYWINR